MGEKKMNDDELEIFRRMSVISYSDVKDLFRKLSVSERQALSVLLSQENVPVANLNDFVAQERFDKGWVCPICGGTHVRRHGHQKNGAQRYLCMNCHKTFQATTNSIVAHGRKGLDVWEKFCKCMAQKMTLQETANVCGIHRNTAFAWRHKVLTALCGMEDEIVLNGITEADEAYFAVSFKGNHKHSRAFKMPRKAHHRGKSIHKRGLSKEQVCVACVVNRSGKSFAEASCLGMPSAARIQNTLQGHIEHGAVFCTDQTNAYKSVVKGNSLKLVKVAGRSVVGGIYHIQHINNYHSQLKRFMKVFNGVSTKHLNNYLVWHNLVNYSKKTKAESAKVLLSFALSARKTVTYKAVSDKPPLSTAA